MLYKTPVSNVIIRPQLPKPARQHFWGIFGRPARPYASKKRMFFSFLHHYPIYLQRHYRKKIRILVFFSRLFTGTFHRQSWPQSLPTIALLAFLSTEALIGNNLCIRLCSLLSDVWVWGKFQYEKRNEKIILKIDNSQHRSPRWYELVSKTVFFTLKKHAPLSCFIFLYLMFLLFFTFSISLFGYIVTHLPIMILVYK